MLNKNLWFETSGFFNSIYENSNLYAILIMDTAGYILAINDTFTEQYGYTEAMIIGKNLVTLFTEEDQAKGLPEKEIKKVNKEGAALDRNYLVHASGKNAWTNGESVLVSNQTGDRFLVKAIQNLDDEKQLEHTILQSNNLLENILKSISDALLLIDESENILKVNRAFTELFEIPQASYENVLLSDLPGYFWNDPEISNHLKEVLKKKKATGNKLFYLTRTNKKKRILKFDYIFLDDPQSAKPALLIILQDETESRILARRKKDSLGFVAHELKTPLTRINLATFLLNQAIETADMENISKYALAISNANEKMNQLIDELSDVTKAGYKKLIIEREPVSFDGLIRETIEAFQLIYPETNIVKKGSVGMIVNIDKRRISQVIENLLSNAVKYAGKNNPIEVTVEETGSYLLTKVKDYGPGIAPENLTHIFKRLYRANEIKADGLGLGLYLCKEIMKAHNGEIWAESEAGKGSVFYFKIPLNVNAT